MGGDLSSFTYTNAKETVKRTRHRHFTEAELYRPLAQLYDSVEAQSRLNGMRMWGWALFSNGVTHLISSFTVSFDVPFIKNFRGFYTYISAAFTVAGIVLLVISSVKRNKPIEKEKLIKEYLDQEFADDIALVGESAQFADGVIDYSLIGHGVSGALNKHEPKHKSNTNQSNKTS